MLPDYFFYHHNEETLITVFGKLQNVDTECISKTFTDKAFHFSAGKKKNKLIFVTGTSASSVWFELGFTLVMCWLQEIAICSTLG